MQLTAMIVTMVHLPHLQTFPNGLWQNSDAVAAYEDQIVCFKTGTYDIYASSTTDYPSINAGVKPISYIGIEANVVFNMDNTHFFANTDNLTFKNIIWDGCDVTAANCRLLQVSTKGDNYMFDGLTYRNQNNTGGLTVVITLLVYSFQML